MEIAGVWCTLALQPGEVVSGNTEQSQRAARGFDGAAFAKLLAVFPRANYRAGETVLRAFNWISISR